MGWWGVRHGRRGWFRGGFGVGCADSSTLSSAPRSTGGYASLHTFTVTVAHTHTRAIHSRLNVYVYNTTRPFFFSSFAFGSSSSPIRARVRTHTSSSRPPRATLSFSLFFFSSVFVPLAARWSLVCAPLAAVTLCSFVSVSTCAESEVSDTDARTRIASLVYGSRSMTVRWRIRELPWSWSSWIYSRNVRAPVNAGHVIPERDVAELPRVCQWRVARRQWWWTDAWKLFCVRVEQWCKYGWHESWKASIDVRKTNFLRSENI